MKSQANASAETKEVENEIQSIEGQVSTIKNTGVEKLEEDTLLQLSADGGQDQADTEDQEAESDEEEEEEEVSAKKTS